MARVRVQEPLDTNQATTQTAEKAQVASAKNFLQAYLAKKKPIAVIVVGLLLIGVIVSLARDKNQLQTKLNQTASVQGAQTDDEATKLKQQIGQTLALPDETPVVTTIQDVTKFNNQAFFKNAQNGDKLLLFAKAGRVVLYRPSTQKVIEFTNFTTSNSATPTTNR